MKTKSQQSTADFSQRYAAKLLFQFRVMVDGKPNARRLCEERIILIEALDGKAALKEAKRRGRAASCRYKNSETNHLIFEFVGVMDLLCLGNECDDGGVWYDITERLRPMERRNKILPKESELNAIRNNS